MANITLDTCRQLAQARRARGMTQSALAAAAGCKQSAISMMEAGQASKIAQETVVKIAALLEVELPAEGAELEVAPRLKSRSFCPNALCLSNLPYLIGEELFFRTGYAGGGRYCRVCGEVLEQACPHCQAVVAENSACCTACGGVLVCNTLPEEIDVRSWLRQQQAQRNAYFEPDMER